MGCRYKRSIIIIYLHNVHLCNLQLRACKVQAHHLITATVFHALPSENCVHSKLYHIMIKQDKKFNGKITKVHEMHAIAMYRA